MFMGYSILPCLGNGIGHLKEESSGNSCLLFRWISEEDILSNKIIINLNNETSLQDELLTTTDILTIKLDTSTRGSLRDLLTEILPWPFELCSAPLNLECCLCFILLVLQKAWSICLEAVGLCTDPTTLYKKTVVKISWVYMPLVWPHSNCARVTIMPLPAERKMSDMS